MRTEVLRRPLALIPVLLGVSIVVFLTMRLIPGDQAQALLGPRATPEGLAELRRALALDQPIHIQYATWLWRVLQGDFGWSFATGRPAIVTLVPKIGNTLILAGASLALAVGFGVLFGVLAAVHPYSWFDRGSVAAAVILGNAPPFWLGLILIYAFSLALGVFPSQGMQDLRGDGGLPDLLMHLALPAITTAAAPGAIIMKMSRASVLEVLHQDFVRVARAKGLAERLVVGRHVFKAALPPIVTISGLQLNYLLGGAIFTEVIFAWPGLGNQLFLAVTARDITVVQGAVLFIATGVVLSNLLADLLVVACDPRIRVS
jgi:peptide/nickel transport system permease protein